MHWTLLLDVCHVFNPCWAEFWGKFCEELRNTFIFDVILLHHGKGADSWNWYCIRRSLAPKYPQGKSYFGSNVLSTLTSVVKINQTECVHCLMQAKDKELSCWPFIYQKRPMPGRHQRHLILNNWAHHKNSLTKIHLRFTENTLMTQPRVRDCFLSCLL